MPTLCLDDVRTAASRTLDERLGASVLLKCESFQRGGAFRFRGAYTFMSALPEAELARELGVQMPAFDHPLIAAGAGAAALELFEDRGPVDTVVVPIGGGNVGLDRFAELIRRS